MDTERLYQKREKRIDDAVALKVPDRVPLMVSFGFFTAKYAGFTNEEVMYDPDKLWEAQWKTTRDFEQDAERDPYGLTLLGPILDVLSFRQIKWAGRGLPSNASYQFVEGEYMKAEEYDHFLMDPSDFIVRVYLPRIGDGLAGLAKLPPLHSIISYSMGLPYGLAPFTLPEVQESLDVLKRAGQESVKVASYAKRFGKKRESKASPFNWEASLRPPLIRWAITSGARRASCSTCTEGPKRSSRPVKPSSPHDRKCRKNGSKGTGNPRIFIPLHKGLDGFMSLEQFKRFFWPTLRALMMGLVAEGLTRVPSSRGTARRDWT